ncbi:DUF6768 family protein [Paraglaciecola sp. 2405UD69-4]|uniref:DUF6768 family protein n=1 Tax=Paraglaciecola sp. 2405UD69-4 TaxID=3391836 RepID=UPI0039C9CA7F
MDKFDKKILNGIQDSKDSDNFSEEQANALQLIGKSFHGTFRLSFIVVVSLQLIFAAGAFYCGFKLLNQDDISLKINWLAGTLLSGVGFAIARIWFFMELNRLSVIREIKRVELQIALQNESSK